MGIISTLLNRVVFVFITGLLQDAVEGKYLHTDGQPLRKSVTVLSNKENAFLSHSFQHKLVLVDFCEMSARKVEADHP